MDRNMAKEHIFTETTINTLVNGLKIRRTAMVFYSTLLVQPMMESGSMIVQVIKES
jgi:hypothetical protein